MIRNKVLQVLAICVALLWSTATYGAWFLPLPQLPLASQPGDAFGVSADGSTIIGTSHNGFASQAVKWSSSGVIEQLGAGDFSDARGVSDDGGVIVGYRSIPGGQEAFRWTRNTGAVPLGDLSGGRFLSAAYGVSGDGSTVVGSSSTAAGDEAFRWRGAIGMVSIGDLPGGDVVGVAYGGSADGSIIVGYSRSDHGSEAFRWTNGGGMIGLDDLPGDGFFSEAYDVSADGRIVVGTSAASTSLFPYRAFQWSDQSGMVPLPDVPRVGPTDRAEAISGDGNVIVGAASDGVFGQAFAWDAVHGSRALAELLTSQGADLMGWQLQVARSASYDGLTIAGLGINPDFKQQPWVARLDAGTFIPEPSSRLLILVGILTLLVVGWHLRRRCSRLR